MRELTRLRGEGAIGASGRHQFRHRPSAPAGQARLEIATNQVCVSLLDRRAAGRDGRRLPRARRQAAGLRHARRRLSVGALAGRGPSRRAIADWSKMKYRRFIDAAGGWALFQELLGRCDDDRAQARRLDRQRRHALGARPRGGRRRDRRRAARRARASRPTTCALFGFALDAEDRAAIAAASAAAARRFPATAATSTAARRS